MARIPEETIERLKQEVSLERLADGSRGEADAAWRGSVRAVPVSRRPRAVAGDQPEEESVALPGRLPDGRDR